MRHIFGTNNMAAMDLSYCNNSQLLIEKITKIKELSDFNEMFYVHLLMNEFYNARVILSKTWDFFQVINIISPLVCMAQSNQEGYMIWHILSVYHKNIKF